MAMMERKNIKKMLENGEMVLGLTCQLTDPTVAEMAALAGYDYIRLDCEHSMLDFSMIRDFIHTADSVSLPVIMRVTRTDDLTALADLGVAGFQIPHMHSAEQAKEMVQKVKYAPVGIRGYCNAVRAQKYGCTPFHEYYEQAAEETLLIVQIEDAEGIEHMEEIIAVEGVDVICTGKGDLSQGLGVIGDLYNPMVDQVENKIMEIAAKYHKPCLVVGKNKNHWIELVSKKNVAMAEYVDDIEVLMKALKSARENMQYLKDARKNY